MRRSLLAPQPPHNTAAAPAQHTGLFTLQDSHSVQQQVGMSHGNVNACQSAWNWRNAVSCGWSHRRLTPCVPAVRGGPGVKGLVYNPSTACLSHEYPLSHTPSQCRSPTLVFLAGAALVLAAAAGACSGTRQHTMVNHQSGLEWRWHRGLTKAISLMSLASLKLIFPPPLETRLCDGLLGGRDRLLGGLGLGSLFIKESTARKRE